MGSKTLQYKNSLAIRKGSTHYVEDVKDGWVEIFSDEWITGRKYLTPMNKCEWCSSRYYHSGKYYNKHGFCSEECFLNSVTPDEFYTLNTEAYRQKKPAFNECEICGSVHVGKDPFCSAECSIIYFNMNNMFYQRVCFYLKCTRCGKFYETPLQKSRIVKKVSRKINFCSPECSRLYQRGKNHHAYIDGGSSRYCSKWNSGLRNRVRMYFNNKCFLCGKHANELKQLLCVHHVNYDKNVCCNNIKPMFVPLCRSCHTRTNTNRGYWENYFENILKEQYDYKCYYTKDEYIELCSQKCSS